MRVYLMIGQGGTMAEKELHDSLIDSIGSSQVTELAQDFAEVTLDSILDDGLIKDIPIVGTIVR